MENLTHLCSTLSPLSIHLISAPFFPPFSHPFPPPISTAHWPPIYLRKCPLRTALFIPASEREEERETVCGCVCVCVCVCVHRLTWGHKTNKPCGSNLETVAPLCRSPLRPCLFLHVRMCHTETATLCPEARCFPSRRRDWQRGGSPSLSRWKVARPLLGPGKFPAPEEEEAPSLRACSRQQARWTAFQSGSSTRRVSLSLGNDRKNKKNNKFFSLTLVKIVPKLPEAK